MPTADQLRQGLVVLAAFVAGGVCTLILVWVSAGRDRRRRHSRSSLHGRYCLHTSGLSQPDGNGASLVRRSFLDVEPRLFGRPRVRVSAMQRDDLRVFTLEGELHATKRNVFIVARVRGREERFITVLDRQAAVEGEEILRGLYCTVDLDLHPVAGTVVLSRQQLEDEQVRALLGEHPSLTLDVAPRPLTRAGL